MNGKQCFNTAVLEVFDRLSRTAPRVAGIGPAAVEVLFPRFMRLPLGSFWRNQISGRGALYGYLFVFLVLFLIQAIWAAANGRFFPDGDTTTTMFMEDIENITNYLIICEAYCIIGYLFLVQTYSIRSRLRGDGLPIADETTGSMPRRGIFAAPVVFIVALCGAAGYALEVHASSSRYWFMESGPPSITLGMAGYYYLFTNLLLLLLVTWVGFAHFGLFHVARDILRHLKDVVTSGNAKDLEDWTDDEIPKRRLAAFAKYVLTSKLMVFCLMLNMLTWRLGSNAGVMYRLTVVIIMVFGVWVFSLPRYAVQRHLFQMRALVGKSTYHDVRGPWALGISSLLDVLLFSFIMNYLFGDAIRKVFEEFLGG